ncbi:MAG: protein-methionine-sulfoxide reductase catalytic subunit MsrP [Alphaproteobacteria bacterium]|nr:protein-methionine-sulfoxide reductase catalytic subunit MsrP [Alphaproteobacteria bacterium]
MLIRKQRGWEIPEMRATPEALFWRRREVLVGLGLGGAMLLTRPGRARAVAADDPSGTLYPFPRNERYQLDRALTDPDVASRYNNFYEFGSHKEIWEAAQTLVIRPWEIRIDGMVEKEMTIAIDDLLAKMPREERLYRHRCVEAWAMAVPWSGFPMAELVKLARPLGSATYVRMETFLDPDAAPGQRQVWYPWPYVESVTIAEAMNELAFLVSGVYGKPLPRQHGAPLRLVLPWKYGFKSIKSIVRISFTDQRPVSFWEEIQGSEYGFWANVNPEVAHPRWSQASEALIGTSERVPTQLYNGYGDYVAALYAGMEGEGERLFM